VFLSGSGVRNVKDGTGFRTALQLTWRERMVISADGLFALPPMQTRGSWRCLPSIPDRRAGCSASMST